MLNIANLDLLAKIKLDRPTKVFFVGGVLPTKHLIDNWDGCRILGRFVG
jgi:hypothetical protein